VAVRYEFVMKGSFRPGCVQALADFAQTFEDGYTVLRGTLGSEQDLPAVLAEFASLGLGLHGVRALPGSAGDRAESFPEGDDHPADGA